MRNTSFGWVAGLAAVWAVGCGGGGGGGGPDSGSTDEPDGGIDAPVTPATCGGSDLFAALDAIDGVVSVTEEPCDGAEPGARCYLIGFEQLTVPSDPQSATFIQTLNLVHRDCTAPMVVADWGYASFGYFNDELTVLFGANALWIEHRYQGASVPSSSGDWDWSSLSIANGAADMHRIITAFRSVYTDRWVSTGASKGGITALYHRYFYPDDLDGTIPYVGPASSARVDGAYQSYMTETLPTACAAAVRGAVIDGLTTRLDYLEQQLGVGAVEGALGTFDWAFWQWGGDCNTVPTSSASNQDAWNFFQGYFYDGGVFEGDSWGALYYEWLTEQGFAQQTHAEIAPYLTNQWTLEDTFRYYFPDFPLPDYDGSVTSAVRAWVVESAEEVLLVYGQYDPWSGGAVGEPGQATSARYFVPGKGHGAQIMELSEPERSAALSLAASYFGRAPAMARSQKAIQAGQRRNELIRRHAFETRFPTWLRLQRGLPPR